jgi:hypothetical protein
MFFDILIISTMFYGGLIDKPSFWHQLIRRKVVKVAISYTAIASVLIQVGGNPTY